MPAATVEQLKAYIAAFRPESKRTEPTIVRWRTPLSNVDWTEYAYGLAIRYTDGHGEPSMILCDTNQLNRSKDHAVDCSYVVDDGESALPFYVSGWCLYKEARGCNEHLPAGYVMLRRLRPHAPYGGHGPRRMWHILISPLETVDD